MAPDNSDLRSSIETSGDTSYITLEGVINERTNLEHVFDGVRGGKIIINLSKVTRINSCGVREWINATRELSKNFEIEFVECSRAIVDQLNMIKNFYSSGKVVSFHAGYHCEACEKDFDMLLEIEKHFPGTSGGFEAPEMDCPQCGAKMCFCEDEEEYFSFIYEP